MEPHRHGTMNHTGSANHYHIHQTSKNRDGPLIYVENLLDMLYVVYEGRIGAVAGDNPEIRPLRHPYAEVCKYCAIAVT